MTSWEPEPVRLSGRIWALVPVIAFVLIVLAVAIPAVLLVRAAGPLVMDMVTCDANEVRRGDQLASDPAVVDISGGREDLDVSCDPDDGMIGLTVGVPAQEGKGEIADKLSSTLIRNGWQPVDSRCFRSTIDGHQFWATVSEDDRIGVVQVDFASISLCGPA